jgi:hypothetical protein
MASTPRHRSPLASTRVGHVLELLAHIVSFLDKPELTRMARVSHAVSALALAALWLEIDNPWLLFRLLDPNLHEKSDLHSTDKVASLSSIAVRATCRLVSVCMLKIPVMQPDAAFWRMPTSVWAWSRFNSYARLVRKLVYVEEKDTPPIGELFWNAILDYDAAPRPLLSSLSDLTWHPKAGDPVASAAQIARWALFAHLDMRNLDIRISISAADVFSAFLCLQAAFIRRGCPNLTRLSLSMSQHASSEAQSPIIDLIRDLVLLEEMHLPGYWGTSSILDALSEKPHLVHFSAIVTETTGWGLPESVAHVQLATTALGFGNLTHLALCIGFSDMLRLFSSMSVGCLIHLHIALPQPFEDASELSSFLQSLREYQPNVLELILRLRNLAVDPSETPRLDLNDLAPLLLFPKLRVLELYCCQPLALTDAELLELLSGLPALERLLLNHEPLDNSGHLPRSLLSLNALNVVSVCCRGMKELGLYLRYKKIGLYSAENLVMPTGLLVYDMGTSPLHDDNVEALTSLFFDIMPRSCELRWGYDFPEDSDMIDWEELTERYNVACVDVNRIRNVVSCLCGFRPLVLLLNELQSRRLVDRALMKHMTQIKEMFIDMSNTIVGTQDGASG